jgi:lactoylglutathione lyase
MIRVKNIDDSLKFYRDFIGLNIINKSSLEDCDLYFLGENNTSCQIELTYNYETPKNGYEIGANFGHFGFAVKNMEETVKKAKSMGYSFMYEPFEISLKTNGVVKKMLIAFIKDPDGNEIELIQE